MVGLPGAAYRDHLKSIDLMEAILPDQIIVSLTIPYPGTMLNRNADLYGIQIKDPDWTVFLQNVYINAEKLGDIIEYRDITADEILGFVETLQQRLRRHQYVTVSEDPNPRARRIKTFLDRPKLAPLRRKARAVVPQ
jgi:hypothetical protein